MHARIGTWHGTAEDLDRWATRSQDDVVPQVLYLIYLPYLGADAAEEELRRGRAEVSRVREDG